MPSVIAASIEAFAAFVGTEMVLTAGAIATISNGCVLSGGLQLQMVNAE